MNTYRLLMILPFFLYSLLSGITLIAQDNSYYLSENGNDANTGSSTSPFKTIAYALTKLNDNDELILKAGTYREVIIANSFNKQIRIAGEPGQDVFINVTQTLPANWELWKEGIWKMQIDFDIWQLFNADELVHVARWPNATFQDTSIWRMTEAMRYTDGGYDSKNGGFTGKCSNGIIYDADFPDGYSGTFNEGDSDYASGNTESLIESNTDFTGAIAVLNVGHWLTWARKISSHNAGDDHFSYADSIPETKLQKHFAYYILGLPALDSENEWWFDASTQTVYYYPPVGANPNELNLQARTTDFALELNFSQNITFENLHFFGGGFNIRNSENITLKNCNFYYPSTNKFVLEEFDWFSQNNNVVNKMSSINKGQDNKIINCEFAYSNAPLYFGGNNILVENCNFHNIEWDMNSGGASGSVMIGEGGVFRHNTICLSGNSEGLRLTATNAIAEYNHLSDMGNLQHDGSGINVGTKNHYGTRVSHNWVHDCNRQGIRFDYHGTNLLREDGEVYGDGVYMNNVTWNTQPNQVKGDRHLILNNTIVNCNTFPIPEEERMNISIQGYQAMHGIDGNESSLTRNNIANMTHRSWNLDGGSVSAYQIPGVVDHNNKEPGAAYKYLNNPEIYDFRPKKGSPLVDAGEVVQAEEINSPVANFSSISFVGGAPDIGAYEYGNLHYWIPGRKDALATHPIPFDGATSKGDTLDLMWREGYAAKSHRVYFGSSAGAVESANESSNECLGEFTNNIVSPGKLEANQTYYWRVDALTEAGVKKGEVWSFIAGVDTNHSTTAIFSPSRFSKLKVAPNPVENEITVFFNENQDTDIKLFNMMGALVASIKPTHQHMVTIDLAHLPQGIYIVSYKEFSAQIVKK
ncbi:T9SS type A sorting domain-containing protein [Carboxylicivirga marina]|uniref:T9SS type A sorting domain-containing protein n=1 Tax=Carboxylicivirga marina TaxID=2800988 RepID=UPI002593413C|nr:T9SS type A sorting domain-containing protein [uncultured Carboxylicivirga sp.]